MKLQCDWTLAHLVNLTLDCSPFQLPDLSHFPQLIVLILRKDMSWYGSRNYRILKPMGFALYCQDIHLKLEKLEIYEWPIIEVPNLSNFPELTKLSLHGMNQTLMSPEYKSKLSGFSLCFQDGHVKLKELEVRKWPFMGFPDLSKFSSLERLLVCDCQDLTSLTASKPLTALKTLDLQRCLNLKKLPAISFMQGLRDYWLEDLNLMWELKTNIPLELGHLK